LHKTKNTKTIEYLDKYNSMLSTSFDTEEKTHENWNYQENLSNGIQWHILKFSQQQNFLNNKQSSFV
jgi:hypothetical protein